MKFSYGLKKLLLIQLLLALCVGGYVAWIKWYHLFDQRYWQYLDHQQTLRSVPTSIGPWVASTEDGRVYPANYAVESQYFDPSFASLHQVFRHKSTGEEVILWLAGGAARDVLRFEVCSGCAFEVTNIGPYSMGIEYLSQQDVFREVLTTPVAGRAMVHNEQPSVWITALGDSGRWRIPDRFRRPRSDDCYRIWIGTMCESSEPESDEIKIAKQRVERFAFLMLPEISDAAFVD